MEKKKENIKDHGGKHCLTCKGFTNAHMIDHKLWCKTKQKRVPAGWCKEYDLNTEEYFEIPILSKGGIITDPNVIGIIGGCGLKHPKDMGVENIIKGWVERDGSDDEITVHGYSLEHNVLFGELKKKTEEQKKKPEDKVKKVIFSHAGIDFILSDFRFTGKNKYRHDNYAVFLKYYDTNVELRISRYDNSRYDGKGKKHIFYICVNIKIVKILKGEIDEDLHGFIKFLEYCFDFEIIDIVENKLIWRMTKNE